jgi:hypothetical protein
MNTEREEFFCETNPDRKFFDEQIQRHSLPDDDDDRGEVKSSKSGADTTGAIIRAVLLFFLFMCIGSLGVVCGIKYTEKNIIRAGGAHVEVDEHGMHHVVLGKP